MTTKLNTHFYRHLNRIRSGVQIFSLLFLVAVPVLNWLGVHWVLGTLYSISIGELDIADPVMALQTILLTEQLYVPLLLAAAVPMVLALIFGRVFCSWMCPQNTFSEWIERVRKRFFRARWMQAHRTVAEHNPHPVWYWSIFAALLLITLVAGLPLLSYLSAPGIISSQIAQAILGMGIGLELGLVALILFVETVFARRIWCKYLCPVGAMLALFQTKRTLHLKHNEAHCTCKHDIEPCHLVCPLGLVSKLEHVYPYCYNCGLCVGACEKTGKGALTLGFGETSTEAPAAADESSPLLQIISRQEKES